MRAVDRIIEKLPGYAEMRGQVSDEAIIAHAAAVYPTTTAIAVAEAEVESEGFGLFGIGDIFNVAKNAIKGVVGAGKGVIKAFSKTHDVGLKITPKEPQPTAAQVAAAVAKEKDKSKAKPSWILPAIIAVVVAVVIVLFVSFTGKAK
ncbi:MAG TPA: hypothetical protein VF399_12015 [bacterium]